VEHNPPIRLTAIGNVEVVSGIVLAVESIYISEPAAGSNLYGSGLQHFEEILFTEAVPEGALHEKDH